MSSSNLNDSTEDSERYSEPLRARSSPYDYRVTVRFEGRSLDVYHGKSPTSAMGAYGQAVRITEFLGRSAEIDIRLTEPQSPYAVYGGFTTQVDGGRVTGFHVPYGRCAEWPINAGATFKPGVRWQGILMFPLYEKAVKAHLHKL